MRLFLLCLSFGFLGCGFAAEPDTSGNRTETAQTASKVELPKDLRTRTSGVDWPQFLGPNSDSTSPETGLMVPWPKEGPKIVWQKELGVGYATVSTSRGRLFRFGRFDNQARLTCCNAETGKDLWKFEYPTDYEDFYGYNNGPRCVPVIDQDRVYLYGVEGMLHCLRITDGQPIWKVNTSEDFHVVQNFFGVGSTPVVHGDLLIVQVGGSPENSPPIHTGRTQPNGTAVVAFDKYTGKVKYKLGDDLASYASPLIKKIDGRDWAFVFARGGLLAFEPNQGKFDFHYPWRARILESVNAANPVVEQGHVLISECYGPGAACLDFKPGDYEVLWRDQRKNRDKSLQAHWCTPIYHEGYLYGCSGRHSNTADIRCIDFKTGKVMWIEENTTRSTFLKVDGHLICLGENGELRLLKPNPEKYEEISRVVFTEERELPGGFGTRKVNLLKYPAWAAPVLSHGLLYVRGEGRLLCLEVIPEQKDE